MVARNFAMEHPITLVAIADHHESPGKRLGKNIRNIHVDKS
jgi:hypothetical protein